MASLDLALGNCSDTLESPLRGECRGIPTHCHHAPLTPHPTAEPCQLRRTVGASRQLHLTPCHASPVLLCAHAPDAEGRGSDALLKRVQLPSREDTGAIVHARTWLLRTATGQDDTRESDDTEAARQHVVCDACGSLTP